MDCVSSEINTIRTSLAAESVAALLTVLSALLVLLRRIQGPPSVWSLIACGRCLGKRMRLQHLREDAEILEHAEVR